MAGIPQPCRGVIEGTVHLYPLRVFYEDTDAGGVVYHASYLRWMERARTDLVELLGIDQRAALESGAGLYVVAELSIRYRAPGRLGDGLLVETRPLTLGRASSTLSQRVMRGDTVLSQADVRICFVDPDGRPTAQPRSWREAFQTLLGSGT